MVAARNQAAVRWRATGTFCGGPFEGIEPTGSRIELEGIDLLTVEDGKIQHNDAYYDSAQFARAVGLLPPADSKMEQRMAGAFNAAHATAAAALQAQLPADRRGRVARPGRLPAEGHERVPDRGRGPGDGLRRRHQGDDQRHRIRTPPASAASSGSSSATATRTTAAPLRGSARRSSAIPTRSRRPRATAESTTSTSRSSTGTRGPLMPRLLRSWDGGPGTGRGHGLRG